MHGSELEARSGDTPVDYNAYLPIVITSCALEQSQHRAHSNGLEQSQHRARFV